ncbi:cation-translocating P-type ATPase [archaeon]|jgi:Ca2+-transporting ATPase|nr:cation-translocating P-type ATPase [archaeon]MBT3438966.1 cation-translocating P-type ATPase [Candidatus Woesearchaeota archaeon]MBT4058222.1 cation-translocating P-type ATPase [Candidatus Woesearchaeota archaeon]MBT4730862.1 cation-translocating P-type ATPase [Candidatus Woesearchaeota archaeon]MBT5042870.1 cation-translocating P-type ATPase [Candidatus Woesearchaeota archaeon]
MFYHDKTVKEVLDLTATHEGGLTNQEADLRLKEYGLNELKQVKRESPIKIFFRQFNNVLVYILLFALIISFIAGEKVDVYVISAILIFNALFGFIQEFKAEKSIELLRKLTTLNTKVIRDGIKIEIPSSQVVKGDLIYLESGDKVPADLRIIEQSNLQADESSLTGESTPVTKTIKALGRTTPLADRNNMLFSSTSIVRGTATAVVVETSMVTEIGKIAKMVQTTKHQTTPLQEKLADFGKFVGYLTGIVSLIFFGVGIIRGMDILEMFMATIALAVAAVPEGLPAVVTVCLALGTQRMVKRNALIRRLSSIETLGCITVICSDKTGTLTKNEMTVTKCYTNHDYYNLTGRGYNDLGEFVDNKSNKIDPQEKFPRMLQCAASCNNSSDTVGDPTERAIYFAAKKGHAEKIERTGEIPFDSDKKYMVTNHDGFDYYKGAPEIILEMCDSIVLDNQKRRILPKDREKILEANKKMAKDALRVIGLAFKQGKTIYFLGLMGMIDPPKEDVEESLKICKAAGITPIMITGDHPLTAEAIAKKIGLTGKVMTGSELAETSDEDLKEKVIDYRIYARVTSAQKVRILNALQSNGEIVAMTGDGVNDAPALKSSDVGIAMSLRGTDIARDASDMILTDDNFSSIVSSIEEGRIIYDNIKKFIKYLLSSNMAEVGLIVISLLAGLPLPLLPLQILWINLMTDSWPALALGVDPAGRDIMKKNPRLKEENLMTDLKSFVISAGIIGTILSLGMFLWAFKSGMPLDKVRTFTLTTLILFEMSVVYSAKSSRPFGNLTNNRWLNISVLFSMLLQILVIYSPLNVLFKLAPISILEWIPMILLAGVGFLAVEYLKMLKLRKNQYGLSS